MAKKRTRRLITGGAWVVGFLILRLVLPRYLPPTVGQVVAFFTVFLAILLAFILFGVSFVSAELSGRVSRRVYGLIEGVIIAGILLGVVGMFQPWGRIGYAVGFHVLLVSTLAFTAWSHVTPKSADHTAGGDAVSVHK